VAGLLVSAAAGRAAERDSYAISADRLILAWPELLGTRRQPGVRMAGADSVLAQASGELTILHLSDMQIGHRHLFGGNGDISKDRLRSILFRELQEDLSDLAHQHGLRPDIILVTGDLTASGLPDEFDQATEFLAALSEAVEVPRHQVAIVPGNHDVNRKSCQAYFADQESDQKAAVSPYSRKWRQFISAFNSFYGSIASFTPDEPWSLFEMPELAVVVAGLNSTMAESHRDSDHYGQVDDEQLRWFARRLAGYRDAGWLRLAAIHHSVADETASAEESLRDVGRLDRHIGQPGLVDLLFHGHAADGRPYRLSSGLIALSAGSPV